MSRSISIFYSLPIATVGLLKCVRENNCCHFQLFYSLADKLDVSLNESRLCDNVAARIAVDLFIGLYVMAEKVSAARRKHQSYTY